MHPQTHTLIILHTTCKIMAYMPLPSNMGHLPRLVWLLSMWTVY